MSERKQWDVCAVSVGQNGKSYFTRIGRAFVGDENGTVYLEALPVTAPTGRDGEMETKLVLFPKRERHSDTETPF